MNASTTADTDVPPGLKLAGWAKLQPALCQEDLGLIKRERLIVITPGLFGHHLYELASRAGPREATLTKLFVPARARLKRFVPALLAFAQKQGQKLVAVKAASRFKSGKREGIVDSVRMELVGIVIKQYLSSHRRTPEPGGLLERIHATIASVEAAWDSSGISAGEEPDSLQLRRLLGAYNDFVFPGDIMQAALHSKVLLSLVGSARSTYGRYFFVEDSDLNPEDFVGFRDLPVGGESRGHDGSDSEASNRGQGQG